MQRLLTTVTLVGLLVATAAAFAITERLKLTKSAVYGTIIETYGTTGWGAQLLTSMFSVPWLPWFPEWEAANLSETMHQDTAAATAGIIGI